MKSDLGQEEDETADFSYGLEQRVLKNVDL
jgi:hypothetical protein